MCMIDRYKTDELRLYWHADTVENWKSVKLAKFDLTNVTVGDCTVQYTTGDFLKCHSIMPLHSRLFSIYFLVKFGNTWGAGK